MGLSDAQLDRVRGAVLGSAVGDALGAPYEAGLATPGPAGPEMIGGGIGDFAPGEWTDDTSMAWAVLDVAAAGLELRAGAGLTAVARRFRDWYDTDPPDVGGQTRRVLAAAGPAPTGAGLVAAAARLHEQTGHTGGNGSLMRTVAAALPYLDDPAGLAEAAARISDLTHTDERAQQACVLWSCAVRTAILEADLDLRAGLGSLEESAAAWWGERIDEAESRPPATFRPNGYVVPALQAAWAAIVQTPVPASRPADHLRDALTTAIGIGDDTDTVAAIAGALLGARWGAAAVPESWRAIVHGYPGLTGDQLMRLAETAAGVPGAGVGDRAGDGDGD